MGDEIKKDDPLAIPEAEAVVAVVQQGTGNPLETMNGVLIVQDFELMEFILHRVCGLYCFKKDNTYGVAPIPQGQTAMKSQSGPGWQPGQELMTGIVKPFSNREDSPCMTKCCLALVGCVNFRPFTMDLVNNGPQPMSYSKIVRPFTWGGCCCCPHTADIHVGGQVVGKVVEDWNCNNPVTWLTRYCEAAFCCRVPYNLQEVQNGQFVNKYRINVNFCFCGPHANFCGSTPFINNMIWDVMPYDASGKLGPAPSGRIQKTYGGCSSGNSFGRWYCGNYSNYVVDWAPDSSVNDRAIIMGASTLIEYIYFERIVPQLFQAIIVISRCIS